MKLLFKQRFFSWFDSYDIYDEQGNTIFSVQGQLSWGHCLHISDSAGSHVGTVQEKILTLLPKFELYVHDRYVGEIRKEFTFFVPKYHLDYKDWAIDGDIFEWDYRVTDGTGRCVATAEKKIFNFTDTYEIDVLQREDALYALMVVLAIDAAQCSKS